MAGTPSPGFGHLKIPLPHDPTDRPYDACLRPIFLRRGRSGPGPAEDRPAIFGRAHLQRFGPTSRPQAQLNLYRIQESYNGISMDLACLYPEYLSVAEPELASRRGGGPRGSRPRTSARGRFRRGALPSALSRPALFGPGLSAWGRSANSVSFLAVSRGRGGRFLLQRRAVAPSPARRLHASRPDARPSPSCSAELMSSLSGRPGCAGLSARTSRRSASGSFR